MWPLKKRHKITAKVTVKDTLKGEAQATVCSACAADLFQTLPVALDTGSAKQNNHQREALACLSMSCIYQL